jgi:hypothetical protein
MLVSTSTSRKMSPIAMTTVDRPLGLGELLAETVRLYGERFWAAIALGAVVAGTFIVVGFTPWLLDAVVLSLSLTVSFGAAARIASGDAVTEAWAQVVVRLPVLLLLTLVVSLPFVLSVLSYLELLLFGAAWIGLTGFAIPVCMLEVEGPAKDRLQRVAYVLDRTVTLARAELVHAVGVAAALIVVYVLAAFALAVALGGLAETRGTTAALLIHVVVAPLFLLGLSILYFEQKARAVSSPRTRKT